MRIGGGVKDGGGERHRERETDRERENQLLFCCRRA